MFFILRIQLIKNKLLSLFNTIFKLFLVSKTYLIIVCQYLYEQRFNKTIHEPHTGA
jgi:hypothetical protein